MDIRPLMVLKNCLPWPIHFNLNGLDDDWNDIVSGQSGHLQSVRPGETTLYLQIIGFRDMNWNCSHLIEHDLAELTTWRFLSDCYNEQGTVLVI